MGAKGDAAQLLIGSAPTVWGTGYRTFHQFSSIRPMVWPQLQLAPSGVGPTGPPGQNQLQVIV